MLIIHQIKIKRKPNDIINTVLKFGHKNLYCKYYNRQKEASLETFVVTIQ